MAEYIKQIESRIKAASSSPEAKDDDKQTRALERYNQQKDNWAQIMSTIELKKEAI